MEDKVSIFWFRRDLRLYDNEGLWWALNSQLPVLPVFIFDTDILDKLPNTQDTRVAFIHEAIIALQKKLIEFGSTLHVVKGTPLEAFSYFTSNYQVHKVFTNRDYEPYALSRDKLVKNYLSQKGILFEDYKDQVIFEFGEILKEDGSPYTVYTPYSRKWKSKVNEKTFEIRATESYFQNFYKQNQLDIPSLSALGFRSVKVDTPSSDIPELLIRNYHETRNYPGLKGTSRLSVHLRFGTISIRKLAVLARRQNEAYLNELIWRDFYQQILVYFPNTDRAFKPAYDNIKWINNEEDFEAWCAGNTGYPLVDAGMRELNQTGFMHNRVRMIVASFLCKHLLIDWRWGEAYFAEKLLDFDLAANNGGWQWAAGSGCDAAPYFRIFNPTLQTKKFDPECSYIRKWVPDFESLLYTRPIVDHETARKRCLEVYKQAVKI